MEGELHFRVDPALDDEVARLLERQRRLLTGLLVAGIEREPVGLNERVVDGVVVAVDEGDGIASVQEQVGWRIVLALLQHDANGAGELGLSWSEHHHPHHEREGTAAEE